MNCNKKMKMGGMVSKTMKPKKPSKKGIKVRGTGAATKGTMARGPMA